MRRFQAVIVGVAMIMGLTLLAPVAAHAQPDIINNLCAGANLEIGTSCTSGSNSIASFNKIVHLIINTLSLIVGVVAVVMIIIGGLRYITSGGSDASVTSAKNTILYAIIGLIIVATAQVLVRFILNKVIY